MYTPCLILLTGLGMLAQAATVTYDFNVSWVIANPDGKQPRAVMGINGQWPIPWITANVGDRVVVNLQNGLGNTTTSLHFHGIYQNGTTEMDGAAGVTQCPVGIGESFTYNFTVSIIISTNDRSQTLTSRRSINLEHIGIILTSSHNIPTACVGRLSSTIQNRLTKISTTKSEF